MKINYKKIILPHLIAVFIFLLVASVYNSYEWSGKKLVSHDSTSSIAASKEMREYQENGEQILWSSKIFSGIPLFQIAYNPKGNFLKMGFEYYRIFVPSGIGLLFSLMFFFYIALLLFGVKQKVAILGAIIFSMSTWFLLSLEASHNSKIAALSYVAPLIGALYYTYNRKLLGALLVGVFTSFSIGANHYQITYYSLFFIFFIVIGFFIKFFKEKKLSEFFKRSLFIALFAVIGVLTNFVVLWTTYSYSTESTRGGKSELTSLSTEEIKTTGLDKDYAMRWSYGKSETFNLLIPGLNAGGYQLDLKSETGKFLSKQIKSKKQVKNYLKGIPMYYGTQPFTSGPNYMGVISIFLFLLLFFNAKNSFKWVLLAVITVTIFFSWGSNFWEWNSIFFNNFPIFNKFRAPSMWLSMTAIAILLGAFISLDKIIKKEFTEKNIFHAGSVLISVVLIFLFFGSSLFSFNGVHDSQLAEGGFPLDLIITDRKNLLHSDSLRVLFVLLISLGLIWAYISNRIKNSNIFLIFIGVLMLFDMWSIGKRYFNESDYTTAKTKDNLIKETVIDRKILKDESYFRVYNTSLSAFNDNSTSFFHHSIGGYSAAKLFRYQDLIERQISKGNLNVFNMLNTKYIINGTPGKEQLQTNTSALGHSWLIKNIKWAKDANEEMEFISNFDPKNTVVIDERFKEYFESINSFSGKGNVELKNIHPDKMEYKYTGNTSNFIVFSEIWYKGNEDWKVYIDNEESKFVRVNYLLRGLKVGEGNHDIRFEFKPKSHFIGVWISRISSLILIFSFLVIIFLKVKNPVPLKK